MQNWCTALQHHSGSRLETQRTRKEEAEKSLWNSFATFSSFLAFYILGTLNKLFAASQHMILISLFVSSLPGRFFPLHFTWPRLLLENLFWTFYGQVPFLWVRSPSSGETWYPVLITPVVADTSDSSRRAWAPSLLHPPVSPRWLLINFPEENGSKGIKWPVRWERALMGPLGKK